MSVSPASLAPRVAPKVAFKAIAFDPWEVRLLDGPFKHAEQKDAEYLLHLEPDRLLSWFRKEAGLKPKAENYGGWEARGVAGHTLGHYLSACAHMYASTGDVRFRDRVTYIVEELEVCQKANGNGYVAAIPEGKSVFAEVAKGDIRSAGFDLNGSWVPWYTLHKLYAGLRDAYTLCSNAKALTVLTKSLDWADGLTGKLTDEQMQKMLACEHGGMNEVCADTYAITGEAKYLKLAERFYHRAVLDPLAHRRDKLTGLHANTQIPKIIGCAREYELTGAEDRRTTASFFWETVTKDRSFVTGGNSDSEHFPPKESASKHIGGSSQETCNTYNMLLLTRHLFEWDPKPEYADFFERALTNHILASQNPESGMMCYYVPLMSGARKTFSTPDDSFWCCVGTGIENHARYNEAIYFHDAAKSLYVNLFLASELDWREKGVRLRQETRFPESDTTRFTLTCERPTELDLKIRHPYWAKTITVTVNGKAVSVDSKPSSYLTLSRIWKTGDTIEVHLPMTLHTEAFADDPRKVALLYGPLVLAAQVEPGRPYPVVVAEPDKVSAAVKAEPAHPLTFTATSTVFRTADGAGKDIVLAPFYQTYRTPYMVYFDAFTAKQWTEEQTAYRAEQDRQKALAARTLDILGVGEMQSERDHSLQGEKTGAGDFSERKWRHATEGGWFSFEMAVSPEKPVDLQCTYWGSDAGGREFDILVNGVKIATQKLERDRPNHFFEVVYSIPVELTKGKPKVTVRLQAHPGQIAGGLFGCRILLHEEGGK